MCAPNQVVRYVCANPTVLGNGQAAVLSEALLCRLVQDEELQMSQAEVEELVVDWCAKDARFNPYTST
jgi:hypothetical protein